MGKPRALMDNAKKVTGSAVKRVVSSILRSGQQTGYLDGNKRTAGRKFQKKIRDTFSVSLPEMREFLKSARRRNGVLLYDLETLPDYEKDDSFGEDKPGVTEKMGSGRFVYIYNDTSGCPEVHNFSFLGQSDTSKISLKLAYEHSRMCFCIDRFGASFMQKYCAFCYALSETGKTCKDFNPNVSKFQKAVVLAPVMADYLFCLFSGPTRMVTCAEDKAKDTLVRRVGNFLIEFCKYQQPSTLFCEIVTCLETHGCLNEHTLLDYGSKGPAAPEVILGCETLKEHESRPENQKKPKRFTLYGRESDSIGRPASLQVKAIVTSFPPDSTFFYDETTGMLTVEFSSVMLAIGGYWHLCQKTLSNMQKLSFDKTRLQLTVGDEEFCLLDIIPEKRIVMEVNLDKNRKTNTAEKAKLKTLLQLIFDKRS